MDSLLYMREAKIDDMSAVTSLYQKIYEDAGYLNKTKETGSVVFKESDQLIILACTHDELGGESVIGTISLFVYNDINTSSLIGDFPEEINQVSQKKKRCALVGRLALKRKFRHSAKIVFLLIKEMISRADSLGLELFICVVNPKHYAFYNECLGFEKIAEKSNLTGLQNAPAVLLTADFNDSCKKFSSFCVKKGV